MQTTPENRCGFDSYHEKFDNNMTTLGEPTASAPAGKIVRLRNDRRPAKPWRNWPLPLVVRYAKRPDVGVALTLFAAFVVGTVTGLCSLVFLWWIGIVGDLTLQPLLKLQPPQSPWGLGWHWLIVVTPALGLLIVAWIANKYAPEAQGNGVPEVISAVAKKHGIIRPRVAGLKALLSGLCIGTGGSVGAEGPIVQIGAAIGSVLGQFLRLNERNVKVLVASGAAAGISATFGAPLAGVIFACEIILGSFSVGSLTPVVISAVLADVAFRNAGVWFHELPGFHSHRIGEAGQILPLFNLQQSFAFDQHAALPLYLVLGLLAGVVSVGFTRAIYGTEDLFKKLFPTWIHKAIVGGLIVGLCGMHPALHGLFGGGYDPVNQTLMATDMQHIVLGLNLLLVLLVLKFVTCSCTLAGGGSGGIFAPSLFLGAVLGGIVGQLAAWLFPAMQIQPGAFSVVGMAAVVAGTTHGPISAVLILFEMTLDYHIILPLMAASVLSSLISRLIDPESIYLKKLSRRHELFSQGHHTTTLEDIYVRDLMIRSFPSVPEAATLREIAQTASLHPHLETLPVVDSRGTLLGIIGAEDLHRLLDSDVTPDLIRATDIVRRSPTYLSPEENLLDALRDFGVGDVEMLPVVTESNGNTRLIGLLPRAEVMRRYRQDLLRHHPSSHRE